jgi:hypothetical protein
LKYSYGFCAGGFFVEAGAGDGEERSDSIHFELNRGWQVFILRLAGIYIEAGTYSY